MKVETFEIIACVVLIVLLGCIITYFVVVPSFDEQATTLCKERGFNRGEGETNSFTKLYNYKCFSYTTNGTLDKEGYFRVVD